MLKCLFLLPSVFDVTGDGVDERVNCTVGELGACGGDGHCPYQRWVHIDFAQVGKPFGHADGQDRRRQPMSDQLGSDRVIGNLESVGRADPYSGEADVDALSDSPSEREVDEILSGKVDQWYA